MAIYHINSSNFHPCKPHMIKKVLDFWFTPNLKLSLSSPLAPISPSCFSLWFGATPETDNLIIETFLPHLISLSTNPSLQTELLSTAEGAMACIIVFDQFSRNVFRNRADAFKYDHFALETAKLIREKKWDLEMNPIYRGFAYLPFEHSESLNDQLISVQLYQELYNDVKQSPELDSLYGQFTAKFLDYAILHRDIIQKFGRYPHRNFILGRSATPEEVEYLDSGAETFGVSKTK